MKTDIKADMKKLPFDQVFPQVKGASKIRNKQEMMTLAKRVAAALQKESEQLAKDQQNSASARFFYQAS
jgi:hypothetical protein